MIELTIQLPDGRARKFYGTNRIRAGRAAANALMNVPAEEGYAFLWGDGRLCRLLDGPGLGDWYLAGGPEGLAGHHTPFRRAILRLAIAAAKYGSRDVGPAFLISGPPNGNTAYLDIFVEGQAAGYWRVANPYRRQPDFFVVWGQGLAAEESFGDIERMPDGSYVRGEADLSLLTLGDRVLYVRTVAFLGDGPIPSREGDE